VSYYVRNDVNYSILDILISFYHKHYLKMNNSPISRLSVIAVIATSLLAVGVVAAISMTEEADAYIRQRNSVSGNQIAVNIGGGTASNTATITQSNTATQTNTNTP
jgi:hypothetical protein